ncbi:PTS sugar transporter subunit IIC [Longimicrobium sp.]|uniref:PTS sugar transporter subunit IIC n=1 Tax=Longimicrobium sp. TaxID=2029185 RepID=UPI002E335D9F|nr:PTS sugar transporter subunit IIC [Longimicrobium sp.]HEX6042585.1 PTS sugar transporter subunit IIC [Longimicrobium sp.]
MIPDPLHLLLLGLLGGVLALDATSLGQFMLSRPLIAAGLAGMVMGNPHAGIIVGLLLEAIHLAVLPVGAARYPEAGPAAVAAAGAYAGAGTAKPVALLASVVFMLAWGWVGGRSVEALRRWNARSAVPAEGPVDLGTLERLHARAIGLDFLRGVAVTLLGLLILGTLLETLGWIPFREQWTRPALAVSAAAALASSLRLFGRRRLPLFVAGGVAGALLLWLR